MTGERERLFFALWPPDPWQNSYHAAVRRCLAQARGRWIPASNLHITLVFLGSLTRAQRACVEQGADGLAIEAFDLDLARVSFRPRNKMVWGLPRTTPQALIALVTRLRDVQTACGLEAERRAFVPHLTLLRDAAPVHAGALEGVTPWPVRGFALVRSQTLPQGARYEVVREWGLVTNSSV